MQYYQEASVHRKAKRFILRVSGTRACLLRRKKELQVV